MSHLPGYAPYATSEQLRVGLLCVAVMIGRSRAFGHGREGDSRSKDTFVEQLAAELHGQPALADNDGRDRRLTCGTGALAGGPHRSRRTLTWVEERPFQGRVRSLESVGLQPLRVHPHHRSAFFRNLYSCEFWAM